MKKLIIILIAFNLLIGCNGGCKGNRDEEYIRGIREFKEQSKDYWDSVNKLSKEPKNRL